MSVWDAAAKSVGNKMPGLPQVGDMGSLLTSMLSSFASAFEQTTRLLKLNFASDSGIPANLLLPHRLTGREAINEGFRYELEALSSDVNIELKTLLGQPVEITILTDAGTEREICGIVTGIRQEGADGGFAVFKLVVESGLSVLSRRVTARVFTQTNVRDLTARILKEHLQNNTVLAAAFSLVDRCKKEYPEHPFWMQYNESDADYLRRIWAREGISFVVLPAEGNSADHPQHALVLFDESEELEANASASVRFHRADGTEQQDAITQWNAHRVLQSGSVSRASWDHASATLTTTREASQSNQGEHGNQLTSTLDDYTNEPHLEEHGPDPFANLAARRVQVKEQRTKFFEGEGSVRTFQAGTWFTLTQHPNHTGDDRNFVITSVTLEAVNNLPKDLKSGFSALAGLAGLFQGAESGKPEPPYTNHFTCLRWGIPILPEELAPPVPGLLTARVVGPGKDEVHTDDLGRIKVRFLFTREEEHGESGASETDADSTWVRQSEVWSSQGFGGNFVPRVGDEVIIQFLGDDPDKPVATGCVYNGAKTPASFTGVSALPLDKTLSGFHSKEHFGSGASELVLDDTTNELRARLATTQEQTELNLGHLVHPRSGGEADPRGEGFELRTDAWGAIRAEKGLLISTDGRAGASGHHADPRELTEQTNTAIELTKALSDASENHQAMKLAVNDQTKNLKKTAEEKKSHAAGEKTEDVAAFKESILGLSSPAGIVEGTPGTIVKSTGKHFHLVSGQDTNLAVGRKLVMAVQEAWSVLAAKGIKLFAGKGDVAIQAHEGSIHLVGEKETQLIACNQGIDLAAPSQATLAASGCKVTLEGGSITLITPGNVNVKATWNVVMPKAKTYDMPSLPKVGNLFDQHFILVDETTGEPLPDISYELVTAKGKKFAGRTDANGRTCKVSAQEAEGVKINIFK